MFNVIAKKKFRLIWLNSEGKKKRNWVVKLSETSFLVLRKDGTPKVTSNKDTDNYMVIIPDPGFELKPATMNLTYAELELAGDER